VVSDIETMHDNMSFLQAQLGQPVAVKGEDVVSIWVALDMLGKAISDIESHYELLDELLDRKIKHCINSHRMLQQLANQMSSQEFLLTNLEPRFGAIENSLRLHTDCFKHIKTFLQQISTLSTAPPRGTQHLGRLYGRSLCRESPPILQAQPCAKTNSQLQNPAATSTVHNYIKTIFYSSPSPTF
jgi:hypothetical protein